MNLVVKNINALRNKLNIIALFAVASLILVYFMPKQGKFRYEYQKGQPWKHNDLIANFDFAILKTDDEIRIERDSIIKQFKPYFKVNSEVYPTELKNFNDNFNQRYADAFVATKLIYPNKYLSDTLKTFCQKFGQSFLEFAYSKGIVNFNDLLEKSKGREAIMIVDGSIANPRNVDELFTQKIAYTYLNRTIEKDYPGNAIVKSLIESLKLYDYIKQNLDYDEATTHKLQLETISSIPVSLGMVQAGERVISKGDLIHNDNYRILESFRKEYIKVIGSEANFQWLVLGYWLILALSFGVLFLFLYNFRSQMLDSFKKSLFIVLLIVLMVITTSVVTKYNLGSIYLIPYIAIPIIVQAFYYSRLAFFIHLVNIMICGFMAPNGFEFIFLQFVAGAVSIFTMAKIYKRGQLFYSVGLVIMAYLASYTALATIQEGDFRQISFTNYYWFIGNGLLLLSSYPLIFLFEKMFGFVSDVTLIELSDTNHPLLRELAEKAPGTFQHVMMVSNLAEEAIRKIDGNPLLMRVGALYHDIGKTGAPGFFIENQIGGGNPHERLNNMKSAEVIIEHVNYGVRLAKKHRLPQAVIDFIVTHHGSGLVKYFYNKYSNEHPDEWVDESKFMYPGPSPFTKETAVLMMADAVEASSRTLKEYNEKSIDELVERIINNQINDQQFIEADITFRDILMVKEVFKQKLLNIYHNRIEYPEKLN